MTFWGIDGGYESRGQAVFSEEVQFQNWYAGQAKKHDLDPDPDHPDHFYDWRGAWKSGVEADEEGHWPSQFKKEGHPNLIIDGIDTRTGQPVDSPSNAQGSPRSDLNLGTEVLFPEIDQKRSDRIVEALGKTWPVETAKGFVKGITGLVNMANRAYKGEAVTTEEMANATSVFSAEMAGAGPATASLRSVGLGMFGGRMSKRAVQFAEEMEERGFPASVIKDMSGLERGADKNWRREFSDSGSDVLPENFKTFTLMGKQDVGLARMEDILKHDELYSVYPEAKDIPVVSEKMPLGNQGSYSPSTGAVYIANNMLSEAFRPELKKTLLHEIQHWIQHKEGFASGGNPSSAGGKLTPKVKPLVDLFNTLDNSEKEGKKLGLVGEKLREFTASAINKIMDNEGYRALMGEVEARNVERRRNMTAKEIRQSLGESTERIPRSEQIYKPPHKP